MILFILPEKSRYTTFLAGSNFDKLLMVIVRHNSGPPIFVTNASWKSADLGRSACITEKRKLVTFEAFARRVSANQSMNRDSYILKPAEFTGTAVTHSILLRTWATDFCCTSRLDAPNSTCVVCRAYTY